MTNTFSDLCKVNSVPDSDLVTSIMRHRAPKALLLKNVQHPHSSNPQIKMILSQMPQMLLRYGIDPDQLRVEMAEADAKTTQIEEGYDEMVESAKEKWTQWV